jgi:hypothetical protein
MNIFFPQVSGSSLAGEHFEFPRSFGADMTLAIVAFWDWQQPMVDTWIEAASQLERQSPSFEYFEMPVLQRSMREVHQFIDNGMRVGTRDRVTREKTVTLYVEKREFLRSIGLPTDDEIYAILAGPSGLIMRIWSGSATPDTRRQLEELVWTAEAIA